MHIGIDDTDSPAGGCTTHFALEAAAALQREHGLVLAALPRLVRLNPNIPWKTRGNAALGLVAGAGSAGETEVVGSSANGTPILLDPAAAATPPGPEHLATLERLCAKWCDLEAPGTDPAFVLSPHRLPDRLYEEAVKEVVTPATVAKFLAENERGVLVAAHGDGRGVVGAAAATAYPARDSTFEFIAYRRQERWGTPRRVAFDSVDRMDRAFPSTYHNLDRRNRHIAVAPATPCPVLFGIRAVAPGELRSAAAAIDAGEPWGGWMLFETNQGTDAHVVETTIAQAEPMRTVSVEGAVSGVPSRLRGGHVVFSICDAGGDALACAAYEPTKEFRDVVSVLAVGDRVRAVGAIRGNRRTLNLEKLQVIELSRGPSARRSPPCPRCETSMKSSGARGPWRCRKCGAKQAMVHSPPSARRDLPRLGWYEVPICARRHLARPLDPHGHLGALA